MGRWFKQLEFRWSARPAVAAVFPAPEVEVPTHDGGLTAWCNETAKALGLPELSRRVRVSWNSRMRTTAGRAWWPDRLIELNVKLRDLAPEELWRTLKHELAHLVAYERAGRKRIDPHGAEWRAACAELGIPNEQPYHTLPFKGRRLKRNYAYVCPNCFETIRRVKPIRRAVACYACCRKFNGGVFHARFELIEQKVKV
jgi:predicted SprT family Zn-dependent metalloprotease